MVALSNSTLASSALVLGSSPSSQQRSTFLDTTKAPKSSNELIANSVSTNPSGIVNQTANVAAPAKANIALPSDISTTAIVASNLGSTTSVDNLVERSVDVASRENSEVTSRSLNVSTPESLKKVEPQGSSAPEQKGELSTETRTESITNTSNAAEKQSIATANAAYTTTANYGQSGAGGSGGFSLLA